MSRLTTNLKASTGLTHPCVYWDNWFTEEDLVKIENYLDSQHLEQSTVMEPDGNNENAQLRDSLSSFVHARPDNQWIFNKLLNLTEVVNSEFYRYDLVGFNYIQYTVYNYLGANYDFHIDTHLTFPTNDTDDLHRKLSFSLILSDSGDYTGGDFEIKTGFNPVVQEQKRGRVLAFPSWVLHRVTPIKTGARKSIVFWAKGPKFK